MSDQGASLREELGLGSFASGAESGAGGHPNGKVSTPVGQLLSEVEAERVEWLWRGRIPKKLTLMDGNPGEGKSALSVDLAARKSVGRAWPDGQECEAGGVVICSAEDGLSDTIRPRLDAAGGDPEKVLALATVSDRGGERLLSLPEDLDVIRGGIERVGAELVIIDPLTAFLSGAHNSHKDQDVRRALAPLAKLAEETGAALLVIRHLNKANGGNPLYRGGGSIGIIGAARSALLVARHPDDDGRRVLAPLKSNLAAPSPSLVFMLTEASNGAVRIEWKGATTLSAAELLAAPVDDEERDALTEAQGFLREVLKAGPLPAKEVKKQADTAGISWRSVERAKSSLGIKARKQGMEGGWVWPLLEGRQTSGDGGLRGTEGENGQKTPANAEDRQEDRQAPDGEYESPANAEDREDRQVQSVKDRGGLLDDAVRALLVAPPDWLSQQLERCRHEPERFLNPTASAIATEVFSTASRWHEVLPLLKAHIGEQEA